MDTITTPSDYYHASYAGKRILVKASGELLTEDLYRQIAELTRADIRFILVGGAGAPLHQRWERYIQEWNVRHPNDPPRSRERPMHHGVGITSAELMEHAVLPIHEETRAQIARQMPDFNVLEPSDIVCEQQHDLGLVGEPRQINGLDRTRNVAALSVGTDAHGTLLNVNADATARRITEQLTAEIDEVIFLTGGAGGVTSHERRVPVIFSHDMREDGTHATIEITGGMCKKCKEIRAMLPTVGKVVLTRDLQREIESVFGSGTMFVDSTQLHRSMLLPDEATIFRAVNERNVAEGKFRQRSTEELRELEEHHSVVKIKGSLLGGFSLVPRSEGWAELAALWAGHLGNGMGEVLSKHFREAFRRSLHKHLYALSTPDKSDSDAETRTILRFTRYGFCYRGKLHELQRTAAILPPDLLTYDTESSGRKPLLFTMEKPERP
jgi:acetylglutamate kinase